MAYKKGSYKKFVPKEKYFQNFSASKENSNGHGGDSRITTVFVATNRYASCGTKVDTKSDIRG